MAIPPQDGDLEALLEYVHERRNFDFRGYKRASLSRRIFKRMQAVEADGYEQYMEMLEANPGEFVQLFNTILINVTALMRDREAWEAVAWRVIPDVANNKRPDDPIRVWSAGAASGEEAYTLAVLLAEELGEERFRRVVKIYATDADSDALVQARHGRYTEKDLLAAFGEERARRFFEFDGGTGALRGDLRRALIFGRHDLAQDPPISRIDLLVCRNTLMYFTSEMQARVLASFHFALTPGGYLFLGKSEALVARTQLFDAVDLHQHIFRKDGTAEASRSAVAVAVKPDRRPSRDAAPDGEHAFEQSSVGQVILDTEGVLLHANRVARRLFSLGASEIGRSVRALPATVSPADLGAVVERAIRERTTITIPSVAHVRNGDPPAIFDVTVSALDSPEAGASVTWLDVTRFGRLREELDESRRELETAYDELQSAVEELETTNEELQSTNEELETTNEELHSTNEELETMNEELQSINEELETINNALRERTTEVEELNRFQQSILSSLRSAVIVLGGDMEVRAWNRQTEELWGLRSDEVVGQHFLNLDIGLPVERLRTLIRDVSAGRVDNGRLQLDAVNRRGKHVTCDIHASPLLGRDVGRGVILSMEAAPTPDPAAPAMAGDDGATT